MGIFHQKPVTVLSDDDKLKAEEAFIDQYFREELRNHARWYFEKLLKQNADLFRDELAEVTGDIKQELQGYVKQQMKVAVDELKADLNAKFSHQFDSEADEYAATIKREQATAVELVKSSSHAIAERHKELESTLDDSVKQQQLMLDTATKQVTERLALVARQQDEATGLIEASVKAMQTQKETLEATIEKGVAAQQSLLVDAFEHNMARVVERYVQVTLGEQLDMKTQLPGILKQLERDKQAILDDIRL